MNTLHCWTDADGHKWACGAYDHGPFCRLCQPVDDALAACLTNVEEGLFSWRVSSTGAFEFQLTPAGLAQVDQITAVPVISEMLDTMHPGWRAKRDGSRCRLHRIRDCESCISVFGEDA